jgi:subtilase family serine protease
LLFKTDSDNYQGETDENDNVYVHAIDIAAPNLIITGVTAPSTTTAGQSINLSWTVENNGSVTTGSSYWYDRAVFSKNQTFGDSDDVYLTEGFIYSSYGLPLEANETYTVNTTLTLPGQATGSGYLLFKTDSDNYQGETDENDNVYVHAIDIAAPNLTISTASAPTNAILGQSLAVSWTVANTGSVPANADWYDSVYLSNDTTLDSSDQQLSSFWQGGRTPLAAGGSYTDSQNITISSYLGTGDQNIPISSYLGTGDRYLIFATDYYSYYYYNNLQGETDETDNTYVLPISLSAPDLIVTEATAPSSGATSSPINVSWTVKNQGDVAALTDWYDTVYLSSDNILGNFNDIYVTDQYISSQTPLASDGTYTISRTVTLPNVTSGDYYLFVRTDAYSYQGETDETNNYSLGIPITIGVPDLIIATATAPESGALGGSIQVSWTVENQGDVEAGADWTDYIYWSRDNTYDFSDTFITSISAASQTPVLAGGNYSKTQNIILPNQLSVVGDGYLIVLADGNNVQGETNENNNTYAVPISINAPDLIVFNATTPASVNVGATINISWDVTNQGTVAANADWYDRVVISTDQVFGNADDTYLTEVWQGSFTPLAAGATYSRTLNVTLPTTATGDRYLLFKADQYNHQGETDENNNVYSRPINISAADLQVSGTNAPTAAVLGETVELTWTVTNQGTGVATRDWYDLVYLSGNQTLDGADVQVTSEYIATQTPLEAGASYTISKNVVLPSFATGNQYLLFVADSYNYQGESNENNNVRSVAINLGAPDLIVSAAAAPTNATVGKSVEVSWTVQNQGTIAAPADWYDRFYLSNDAVFDANADTYITQELISTQTPLAAGASYSITRNINLPNFATGSRYLIFVADGSGGQGETNENNNTRAVAINLNAPDLVVSDITAPVETLSGQPIDLSWTVTNQGNASAEGTWYDYVYLVNTATSATQYVGIFEYSGSLAAGASLTRTQSYSVPLSLTGNYRVVVTADYYGYIAEGTQNESNNTATDDRPISIQLSPVPNLQVTGVNAPPTAFSSQETVVQWTVKNVGTGATNAPVWYDRVYLSLDTTYDNTDTYLGEAVNPSYLNPNDSYSNSLNVTLPRGIDGNYYFLIQADIYNHVTEVGNEGDNWGSGGPTDVNLTPPPDLQVTAVNAPNGAFSGQPMNLSWTVTNAGTGRTLETAWYDRVFMSADATLDAGDRFLGDFYHSGSLNAGANYTGSATVNLPIGVAGSFFFFVQSDIYNNVYEHAFENNNTGYDSTATNITLTPPPDLEFESLTIPNNARSGGNLSIDYRVTNFGATETPNSSWTDTFYLSSDNQLNTATDINLGSVSRYGILNPDDGYDRIANFTLPNTLTGTYYVFGVTDSSDVVFELNNANNTVQSSNQVQIVSQPADLVVTDGIIPTNGEAGKTIQVQWTVKNQGAGDTIVNSWSDRIVASSDDILGDADDITLANFTRTGLLAPNGTYSRTESVILPFTLEGNYQLFVVTDSANSVYESSNEGNNGSSAFPITISRNTPDLQVTSITLPGSLTPGQPLLLNWTVANSGAGRTNSNYWYDQVYLSLDKNVSGNDINLGSVYRSGALDPSASYSATGTFSLPITLSGSYYVLVQTDWYNNVIEGAFENNNVLASDSSSGGGSGTGTLPITPAPSADLAVASVDAPEQGIAGQSLSLTWTVVNNDANTGQSWYDTVYLSRDQVFDRSNDIYLGYRSHTGGLNGGDSYTATQSFNVPRGLGGRYYAFVVADGGNAVYERLGEVNNVNYDGFSTEIIIPPPSDLVVTNITVPTSGIPGQGINITYTVQNQGTDTSYGSWTDSVYLSRDTQWDIGDALVGQVNHSGDVAGGASYTGTLNNIIPGVNLGNYHVIVRSDIRNQVPEVNENNNTGVSGSQITLDVEALTLGAPDTGNLGQGQYVYYRVDVEAGETLKLALDGQSDNALNELYVRYGEMPTRGQFDFTVSEPFVSDPNVIIPSTQAGTYYIMAYGDSVPTNQTNYSIQAEILPFGISHLSTNQGGNSGQVTLQLQGAKFDELTKVELIDGNTIIQPIWYDIIDPTRMTVTFDLKGKPVGQYDLHAFAEQTFLDVSENTGEVIPETIRYDDVTLTDQFTIVEGGGAAAAAQLLMPSAARFGNLFSFYVEIANEGTNDLPVPVYRVASPNGTPLGTTANVQANDSSQLQIMAVGELRSTVLAPGERVLIPLFAKATQEPSSRITLENLTRPGELIDWDALEGIYRDQSSDTQWTATWGNFQGIVGDSWDSFHEAMRQAVDDLPRSQDTRFVPGELLIQDLLSRARLGQNDSSGFIEEYNGEGEQAYYALIEQAVEDYNNSLGLSANAFVTTFDFPVETLEERRDRRDRVGDEDCAPGASTAQLVADEAWATTFVNGPIRVWFGSEVAGLWSEYLSGTPSSPPARHFFTDSDAIGQGFKNSQTTANVTRALMDEARSQFLNQLNSGMIDCDNLPTEIDLVSLLSSEQIEFYQNSLNYNVITEIPGNIAGGIGSIDTAPDTRKIEGKLLISVQKDDCDKVTSIEVKSDLKITVEDGLDFCPGDLGAGLEQVVTRSMRRLEANGWAYDVPFTVTYNPEVQTLSISASELPEGCEPDQTPPLPPDPCNPTPPDECDDNNTPPSPPPDCDDNDDEEETPTVRPRDPNDIIGPNGFGDEKWISASDPFAYTIRFENQSTATAPAQQVTITHPLDADVDFRTFRVGSFGWGGFISNVPNNRSFYNQRLDLTADYGFYVDVLANIDVTSGVASWTLTTIDPETGEIPENPLLGFLPPNNEDGVGDGFVTYTIRTGRNAETGDVIDAEATIIFDTEEPISTPPIFNTLDVDKPSSEVNELPETTATPEFLVSWTGADVGSALATYTIYVSENGGEYTIWLDDTELTEATYTGTAGRTYAFYSVAADNAGNTEAAPTTPDATITLGGVVDQPPVVSSPITDVTVDEDAANTVIDLTNVFSDVDGDAIVKTILTNTNTGLVTATLVDNELTLDYLPNQFGTAQITVRGTANGQTVDDTFTINVGSVDDAPVVSNPISDVSVNEDAANTVIDLTNVFSDVEDGDAIVKTILTNTNTGLVTATLVDNQLTLDYLPNQFGTAQITVRGTANGQTVDDTFNLTVNAVDDAPVVSNPIADVTVNEDASDTVINLATVFSDADGDVVVKSIVTNSNNTLVTTSLQNNTLTLDYLPNQFGTAQITVRGTANGQSVEDTFTLTVNGVNDAPTVNKPIDTQILTTNNAFSFTIPSDTFSDVDTGDTLSYTINNDSTFTLTNLTITGTPTQTGTKTLTLVATDSQGLTAQTPIQLSIFNPVTGATNGDNTLTGTDGDDLIDARDGRDNVIGGRGNDRIVGGSGADVLGGGEGRDTFVYTSIRDSGDRLTDFDVNQDYLDFSALLDSLNYTGSNPVTDGYVSWRTLGTGTLISVDSDGTAGRGVARPFITLEGVISSALTSNNFVF